MVRSLFNVIEANGYGEAVLEELKHIELVYQTVYGVILLSNFST